MKGILNFILVVGIAVLFSGCQVLPIKAEVDGASLVRVEAPVKADDQDQKDQDQEQDQGRVDNSDIIEKPTPKNGMDGSIDRDIDTHEKTKGGGDIDRDIILKKGDGSNDRAPNKKTDTADGDKEFDDSKNKIRQKLPDDVDNDVDDGDFHQSGNFIIRLVDYHEEDIFQSYSLKKIEKEVVEVKTLLKLKKNGEVYLDFDFDSSKDFYLLELNFKKKKYKITFKVSEDQIITLINQSMDVVDDKDYKEGCSGAKPSIILKKINMFYNDGIPGITFISTSFVGENFEVEDWRISDEVIETDKRKISHLFKSDEIFEVSVEAFNQETGEQLVITKNLEYIFD